MVSRSSGRRGLDVQSSLLLLLDEALRLGLIAAAQAARVFLGRALTQIRGTASACFSWNKNARGKGPRCRGARSVSI